MTRRIQAHSPKYFAVHGATNRRVYTFLAVGFTIGLCLGYVAMGTVHAFLAIGAEKHHQEQPVAEQQGAALADANLAAQRQQQQQAAAEQQLLEAVEKEAAQQQAAGGWPTTGDTVHVLATSNGSPYLNFQTRIMYATFKLAQAMPGGEKLAAFTRILHRSQNDILVNEVPTFRANPQHPECDEWCEYPVADRPSAVRQFFDAVKKDPTMVQAPWLYMIETDYVWMKPLQMPPAEDTSARPIVFPFGYIQPTHANAEAVMRKYYPETQGPLSNIPNTGPAPAVMRVAEWLKVIPLWEALADQIEKDPESVKVLGWVREMYAFSLALALSHTTVDLTEPPKNKLIVQPPADHVLGEASCAHYTWGAIFNDKDGHAVWSFDKRTYTGKELETKTPYITEPPPLLEGWRLQDGVPVDAELHGTMLEMIRQMNRGVYTLKDIPLTTK